MKRSTLLAVTAASLLLGSATAFAQQTTQPGASGFAPGQQDRTDTDKGASSFAPGQMQKSGEGAAKDFAPGQQMKNPETNATGTTGSNSGTDPKAKKDLEIEKK